MFAIVASIISSSLQVLVQRAAVSAAELPVAASQGKWDSALSAITSAIRDSYVFPDKTPHILDSIEANRRAGRYDTGDARIFAQRLTDDLLTSSGDHHLYLSYDPERYAMASRSGGALQHEDDAYERTAALRDNSGLADMALLPGNLRYLKVSQFEWLPDETGAVYDDAMRFLRGGDAIIIDLRGNPGGDSSAVRYLVSHFLDPGTLEYTFLEGDKQPVQMRALDYVPAGRIKKPLYVLIDGGVASAAESFAYDVQQFKLGELVGENTIGAANNNRLVPIAPGFMLSVSFGRPVHAVSGTNWEGSGITPSVPVAAADALDEAQLLALTRLEEQASSSPEAAAEHAWALVAVESRLKPADWPISRLQSLAGHYGDIEIKLTPGQLWLTRPNRTDKRLSPLTMNGLFAIEGVDRVRLQLTGDEAWMYWQGDPTPRRYRREGKR